MSNESERKEYGAFDLVRLIVALFVVGMHVYAQDGGRFPYGLAITPVPIFLAVSGFLVLRSWNQDPRLGAFFAKRALRVLPAMAVSLLLVWGLLGWDAIFEALHMYVTAGLSKEYFANAPLWSLLPEEVCYASLCLLALIGAYRRIWPIVGLTILSAVLYQVCLTWTEEPKRVAGLPLCFLVGNLAYLYRDRLARLSRLALPLALVVLCLSAAERTWQVMGGAEAMYPGNFVLMSLSLLAVLAWGMSANLGRRWNVDISYGLYIYHWPLITYGYKFMNLRGWELWAWTFGLAALVATLSALFVERPALRFKPAAPVSA